MKRNSDDGMFNLFSLFNCLEPNDIKGPACDFNLWVSVSIPRDIPTRFKGSPNDVTVLNYDISSLSIGELCIGTAGYLTQTALNDNFELKSKNPEGIRKLNSIINPYQQLHPLVKEVYTAMEGICNVGDIVRISKYLN